MSIGCSARQGTHQDAKTLTTVTWPVRSAEEKPGCGTVPSAGKLNSGTVLPISAEGT